MPDTFTPNLNLDLPPISAYDAWGAKLNANFTAIDTAALKLAGTPLSATVPTSGQALIFNGTEWVPELIASGTIGGGGAATQIAYFTAALTIASSASLKWDAANKILEVSSAGVGTFVAGVPTIACVGDGTTAVVAAVSYGSQPAFVGLKAGGSAASPQAVTVGNDLIAMTAVGHTGSSFDIGSPGGIMRISASETWTPTAHGTNFNLELTAPGTVGYSPVLYADRGGPGGELRFGVGTTSPSTVLHVSKSSSGAVKIQDTTQVAGYVLTCDANGVGTWQAPTGGGAPASPANSLQFNSAGSFGGSADLLYTGGNIGVALSGTASPTPTRTLDVNGVIRSRASSDGAGGGGFSWGAPDNTSDNFMMRQKNDGSALNIDCYNGSWLPALTVLSSSQNVGLGTVTPSTTLHVLKGSPGAVRIQDTTQVAGYVLTCDANGVGTWQPAAGGGGTANFLATTGASVDVVSAAPPTTGQVLTATDATHATWQAQAGGQYQYAPLATGGILPVLGGNLMPSINGVYSVISGGRSNSVTTGVPDCVIAGGQSNVINSTSGWGGNAIGGGEGNKIGTAIESVICGGGGNEITGNYSSILGGINNIISNLESAILGGRDNSVSGNNSFAMGYGATVANAGSFVYSDMAGLGTSWGANTFTVFANGGFKFKSDHAATPGHLWIQDGTQGASKALVSDAGGQSSWDARPLAYDISGQYVPLPTSNQVVFKSVVARAVTFGASMAGSFGVCNPAATASTTFSLDKNGTPFGTMVFAPSATTATFTGTTTTAPGDVLTVVAPAVPDVSLADLAFALAGSL